MSQNYNTYIFILIVLILLSGLFSAIETAYSSANKIRLRNMENDEKPGASRVLHILEDFDHFLTTILIGNNIVNIAAATLGTILFTRLYGDRGATISTIVITLVVLLFGEITPKSIAKKMPERFACATSGFVQFTEYLFTPVSWIFKGWKYLLEHTIHIEEDDSDIADELITMVDEAEKEGDLEEHESDLISAAIEFNDLDVRDVLTPRVDVVATAINAPIDEIEKKFRNNAFSRLPVYEKNIDNIVGVIHEKDFYSLIYNNENRPNIRRILKPVLYTNENVKISTLLKQLQKEKSHLAVVSDEYGGTAGIITMEDIIEELVGEIYDEHDTVIEYIKQVDEKTYLVKCDMDVDDLFERFGVEPEDDDFDFVTVSGWVIDVLDHIPQVGESFTYENLHITVTKADQRKVLEIKVEVDNNMEDTEDNK